MKNSLIFFFMLFAVLSWVGCEKESIDNPNANTNTGGGSGTGGYLLVKTAGDNQTDTVNKQLVQPLQVQVQDSVGGAKAGVAVNFTISSGGGSLSTISDTTDNSGFAEVLWTLGAATGTQMVSVTANVSMGSPQTFSATGIAASGYTVPTTYNFMNVSYSGPTTRMDMLTEIIAYIETAHNSNAPALNATKLKDMYSNINSQFSSSSLNSSPKNLKTKTIATEQMNFDNYMDAVAINSQFTNQIAANGAAGIGVNTAGTKKYLLNENGVEWAQIIEKGLMGACFYYQATAVYMGAGKMNVDNTVVAPGQGTQMEHNWDQAFGYFGVPIDFPTNSLGLRYWGKFCNQRNAVYSFNQDLMDGLLTGRAAISANDLSVRDMQITGVQRHWELMVVANAIHYLNQALNDLGTDPNNAYHYLSEVFAFTMSLKYSANGVITASQVDTILTTLFGSSDPNQANNYAVTVNKINAAKNSLVSYFSDLTAVKDLL